MTNRQWLASMSDVQLAEFLYGLEDYAHCELCADDGKCHNSDMIVQNCLGGLEKWLQQEHVESGDSLKLKRIKEN
jgi:hypothetical protein